jgi:hypothetical protein
MDEHHLACPDPGALCGTRQCLLCVKRRADSPIHRSRVAGRLHDNDFGYTEPVTKAYKHEELRLLGLSVH